MDNVEEIIVKKNYHELSGDERELIGELAGTEEEFEQMKFLFSQMEMMKDTEVLEPRAEIKRSLDHLFQETHQQKARGGIWLNSVLVALYPVERPAYRRPLLQVAAAVLVILLIVPLFNQRIEPSSPAQLAKNEMKQEADPIMDEKKEETSTVSTEQLNEQQAVAPPVTREPVPHAGFVRDDLSMSSAIDEFVSAESDAAVGAASAFSIVDVAPAVASADFKSDHPDGVFVGDHMLTSMSAADQPELLDLLTATF
ncbi:MAG: hypothetical protein EP305_01905 [Bacteroidetes bacterium]|nr:MAG: hypothetical protein EP305_01905 [Bacteroidota bacterium]